MESGPEAAEPDAAIDGPADPAYVVERLTSKLHEATSIGQAVGLIMALRDVSFDAALDTLSRASTASGITLVELAMNVVEAHDAARRRPTE